MPETVEALLRQVLAGQAGIEQGMEDMSRRIDGAATDAREARDLGNAISIVIKEQNLVTRFSEHKADVRQIISEIRQDMVHAATTARNESAAAAADFKREVELLKARIQVLEDDRQQRNGAKNLITWISEKAPWLLAVLGVAATAFGLGEKLK